MAIIALIVLTACGLPGGKSVNESSEGLVNMLEHGRCRVTIAIWDKVDQGAAEGYRDANNKPTPSCPKPDVTVKVIKDPAIQDGSKVDEDRVALRYVNKATPVAPPPSKTAA